LPRIRDSPRDSITFARRIITGASRRLLGQPPSPWSSGIYKAHEIFFWCSVPRFAAGSECEPTRCFIIRDWPLNREHPPIRNARIIVVFVSHIIPLNINFLLFKEQAKRTRLASRGTRPSSSCVCPWGISFFRALLREIIRYPVVAIINSQAQSGIFQPS